MPGKGILKAVIAQEVVEILKLEGLSGPFDYVVNPGGSFISLADAFQAAFETEDGEIKRWELELEEDNQWEYEIHINNQLGSWEIEINAFTGELISKKIKGEDDQEETEPTEVPQDIIDLVSTLVDGEIIHSEEGEDDSNTWEIFIEVENGGIIEMILDKETQDLSMASGKGPVFDYEFDPGNDLMPFSEAKIVALIFQPGEIDLWELKFKVDDVDPGNSKWIYAFKIIDEDGLVVTIEFDALSGQIEFEDPVDLLPDAIRLFIEQLISGEIVDWKQKTIESSTFWAVTVQTVGGGLVEIEVDLEGNLLLGAEGKSTPFDYEFTPPSFVVLSSALQAATNEVIGEIMRWTLKTTPSPVDPTVSLWIYEVKIKPTNSGVSFVQIDAITGEVIDSGETDPQEETVPQQLIDFASQFVTGEIIDWKEKLKNGIDSWELVVSTGDGELTIYVDMESGELIEAEGKTGPFDYGFSPGNDLIVFSAAKAIATANESGNIVNWVLLFDDKGPGNARWIYEFTITGAGKIKVDASSGEII